jgi:hypothetical protein
VGIRHAQRGANQTGALGEGANQTGALGEGANQTGCNSQAGEAVVPPWSWVWCWSRLAHLAAGHEQAFLKTAHIAEGLPATAGGF